jgi:hypothetical protein
VNYSPLFLLLICPLFKNAEPALVDYFVMAEAIGIVATLVVSFYSLGRQVKEFSIDIEKKVIDDNYGGGDP